MFAKYTKIRIMIHLCEPIMRIAFLLLHFYKFFIADKLNIL